MVLVLLGLIIYYQTFRFGFVFDDWGFIVKNPFIRSFDHLHYIWKDYPLTRCIGFYSFGFNYFINQMHPQGYHIFNFIVHLLAVGLVGALAGVIFQITGGTSSKDRLAPEIPFIVAALFLVHPCQTQAVSYISQRFESMATVFYLGSIYFYLRGRVSSFKANQIILFICSAGFAILGVFTKEVAVTIPLMILAAEFIFFSKKEGFGKGVIVLMVVGSLFLLLFIKLVRTDLSIFFHFHPIPSESHDGDMITTKTYLLTQMRVFLTFVRLLVFPFQQNLDYDYPSSSGIFNPPFTLVGMCLIGLMTYLVFKLRKQFPIIAFGLAWMLITFSINLAPRANIIFEHKLYLISFGFFLVLVDILFILIPQRKLLVKLLIIMIAGMSFLSFTRNQVWKNELTLWSDATRKSPCKVRPYINLASAYFREGDFIQARSNFEKAMEINPNSAQAYYGRGNIYNQQGDFIQALSDYNKAIELNPVYAGAYYNRGNTYAQKGDFTQALFDFNRALEINSNYPEVYISRGNVFAKERNFDQALINYNKAIGMYSSADAYYNRAIVYYKLNEYDKALADLNKAKAAGAAVSPEMIDMFKKAL